MEEIKNNESVKICKWCGRDCEKEGIHPSEDVMKEYFRCMLGQIPFHKEFSLLNDTVKLTFVEPQADIALFIDSKNKSGIDINILRDIRMLASLESLYVIDEDTADRHYILDRDEEERKDDALAYAKSIKELAERVSTSQLAIIRNCSSLFSVLCNSIVDEMVNKNFYEGVGLY